MSLWQERCLEEDKSIKRVASDHPMICINIVLFEFLNSFLNLQKEFLILFASKFPLGIFNWASAVLANVRCWRNGELCTSTANLLHRMRKE